MVSCGAKDCRTACSISAVYWKWRPENATFNGGHRWKYNEHTARFTQGQIHRFGLGRLNHQVYSAIIAPTEYSHFSCTERRTLETSLPKQCWDTADCATIPCISEHRVLPQNGFITMISSCNKCLDIGGNYIEKWSILYSSWCHGVFAFGNKVSILKKQWIFSDFSENFLNVFS